MTEAIQSTKSPGPSEIQYPYRNMGAVLYARVSTDDKGQTTTTQIRELREWCERNHVRIIAEYEEQESGGDLERRVFDSVLGRIARGGVDLLLARDPSRLSRDGGDMEDIVSFVETHSCHIRYSSADGIKPEDENGILLNRISTWQGEIERTKLKANTKKGMQQAKLNGIHCGRMLSFCWTDEVAENRARIQTQGEHQTYIASKADVMAYARQGMTYTSVATTIMHISPNSLKRALKHAGMFDEYQSVCAEARGKPSQGDIATRVGETPEISVTRGGDE